MKLDARKIVFGAVCYHTGDEEKPYASRVRALMKITENTYKSIVTDEVLGFKYSHNKPFIISAELVPLASIAPKAGFKLSEEQVAQIERDYNEQSKSCEEIDKMINSVGFDSLVDKGHNALETQKQKESEEIEK